MGSAEFSWLYYTKGGTSYNAYLIIDKKITVVDTVKNYCFEEMLANIKEIIDPAEIDYLVINHVEMDHAGSIPELAKAAPRAKIVTSAKGQKDWSVISGIHGITGWLNRAIV